MPIFAKVPQPGEAEMLDLLKPAQQIYASKGVTTAQEGATHADELAFLRKAGAENRLILDIVSLPFIAEVPKIFEGYVSPGPTASWSRSAIPRSSSAATRTASSSAAIKLVIDGSPQGKTAYWTKPLLTGGPNGEKDWIGAPLFPKDLVDKHLQGPDREEHPGLVALQRRRGDRHDHRRRERRRRQGRRRPPARRRPFAVHAARPARPLCRARHLAVVLHRAHLLLGRRASRQSRRGARLLHQPDEERARPRACASPTTTTSW